MAVPLVDLSAQYRELREAIQSAVQRVLDSQRYILGPEGEALESEIAAFCECREGVGISSGTDALLVALMALGIQPGDEVIVPSFTFFATAGSVARLGAVPVFVDIDPVTFNMDPDQLEARISGRTRALVPVHLFGQMADMDRILGIAGRHGLAVVEDAAQAIGAEYRGRRAGSLGLFGCFSFYPSKNLGGCGDGGMLTTNDPALAGRARMLRNHGFSDRYHNKLLGGNFRLDEIQAAILRVKLGYLDAWTEARRSHARRYWNGLVAKHLCVSRARGEQPTGTSGKVQLPFEQSNRRHVFNQFVIRAEERDGLMAQLQSRNVGCVVYYPVPLHLAECFSSLGHRKGDFPESEKASVEALALPMYAELKPEMVTEVVDAVADYYGVPGGSPGLATSRILPDWPE